MDTTNIHREKMARIINEQRNMLDTVDRARREMTAEESASYAAMDRDFEAAEAAAIKFEARVLAANNGTATGDFPRVYSQPSFTSVQATGARGEIRMFSPGEQRDYSRNVTLHSDDVADLTELFKRGLAGIYPETRKRYDRRALSLNIDPAGGFVVAPEQFQNQIIAALDEAVVIRQLATIFRLDYAHALTFPKLEHDPSDPLWTSEVATGGAADTTMDFGKRALFPHPLAKKIRISNTLLNRSPGILNFVRNRLTYKFAVALESAFMTGTGVNSALGLFTPSSDGISTARDVSTGNTNSLIKADNLIECAYTLKPQYHKNARWIFHRDAMKQIRKIKDGSGQFIFQAGLAGDRPATILDIPYLISEYCPATFTASQYVGILGDFSFYYICDALGMQVQVLNELYAETNQTGLIGRLECDGQVVVEDAFVRVQLAA